MILGRVFLTLALLLLAQAIWALLVSAVSKG